MVRSFDAIDQLLWIVAIAPLCLCWLFVTSAGPLPRPGHLAPKAPGRPWASSNRGQARRGHRVGFRPGTGSPGCRSSCSDVLELQSLDFTRR